MISLDNPLPNLAATEHLAQRLAPYLRAGDVLALQGALGAGKTTFARSLLQALGIIDDIPSPTFTLLQTYEGQDFLIHHFDLYRLKHADELDELGWDDACAEGLVIVEWPERGEGRMPDGRLVLEFTMNEKSRRCRLQPYGKWAKRLKEMS
jgi:tRNA threonylcarbamoyl adenosine modification protein YjeE